MLQICFTNFFLIKLLVFYFGYELQQIFFDDIIDLFCIYPMLTTAYTMVVCIISISSF
ncbi:hypothetical protein QW060_09380 [Myroides ceti]|uniref:Uncharacterized protein n=1 Tax=Paenimyroides ceti TaxID=395087 RepID=A0ABT8CSG7_9FLAO|nr:hypothetical protein [Paenimyroides ceti]MDN3707345.1 hypothetical protein [Paenimyroides ceti]